MTKTRNKAGHLKKAIHGSDFNLPVSSLSGLPAYHLLASCVTKIIVYQKIIVWYFPSII